MREGLQPALVGFGDQIQPGTVCMYQHKGVWNLKHEQVRQPPMLGEPNPLSLHLSLISASGVCWHLRVLGIMGVGVGELHPPQHLHSLPCVTFFALHNIFIGLKVAYSTVYKLKVYDSVGFSRLTELCSHDHCQI